MDDIRASIGIAQLNKLRGDLDKRAVVRKWYMEGLKDVDGLDIPFSDFEEYSSNYIFPVVLRESNSDIRDSVRKKLQEKGIQTSVHYPAIHKFSAYKEFYRELPNTEYVSDNEITLPMYANLNEEQVDYIVHNMKEVLLG